MLTDFEKGYLAAAIDGEGSILLLKNKDHNYLSPRIKIGNTNKEFILYCQKLLSPFASFYTRTRVPPRQKFSYHTELSRTKAILSILKEITPYLIIKKQAAQELLQWCQNAPIRRYNQLWGVYKTNRAGLDAMNEKVVDLYQKGWHPETIAKEIGRCRTNIYYILKLKSCPVRRLTHGSPHSKHKR